MSASRPTAKIWSRNFIVLTIINLFIFFSFQMIFPVLPLYVESLGGNNAVVGLVMGIFTVTTLVARPLSGYLLDTVGRKQVLLAGLFVFTLMIFSYGWAPNITAIVIVRLLHGFGWGIGGTATATIAAEIIPRQRFGEGMGYFSLANSISMAVSPAVGIYIGVNYGFKTVFYISSFLALCGLCLALLIRSRPLSKPKHCDVKKTLYEKSAIRPAILMFCVSVTYGSIISFLPLYAASRGIPNIGIFFTIYAIAIFVTRPLVGIIVDRFGFDITVIPGGLLLLVGIALLSQAQHLGGFLTVAVFYGTGFGALQTSIQTMAVRDIPPIRLGAANATLFTGFDLGMGLGAMTLGAISAVFGYVCMYYFALLPIFLLLAVYIFSARRHAPKVLPRQTS